MYVLIFFSKQSPSDCHLLTDTFDFCTNQVVFHCIYCFRVINMMVAKPISGAVVLYCMP